MGIDFSHCNAHWAYSGFMGFRNALTKALGYGGDTHLRQMYEDGSYKEMEKEPIWPLIDHSDCDGVLTVEEMEQILPQLITIVNAWPDDAYDKARALELIEGMECAVGEDEEMVFM